MLDTYSKSDVIALIDAGIAISAHCDEQPNDGYVLLISVNGKEKPLRAFRGQIRVFKKPEAALRLVRELGLSRVCFSLHPTENTYE